jgi:cation-transporting ATPase I
VGGPGGRHGPVDAWIHSVAVCGDHGGLQPAVVTSAIGSLLALGAAISTPGVSQLLGSTPLGPLGWAQALGPAAAATAVAAIAPRMFPQKFGAGSVESNSSQSTISTTPARHSTAYSSRSGTVRTRATASVSGSPLTPVPGFDTSPTVTRVSGARLNRP